METETHPLVVGDQTYVLKFDRAPSASRFILVQHGEVLARGLIDGAFNPPVVLTDDSCQLEPRLVVQIQSRWVISARRASL